MKRAGDVPASDDQTSLLWVCPVCARTTRSFVVVTGGQSGDHPCPGAEECIMGCGEMALVGPTQKREIQLAR